MEVVCRLINDERVELKDNVEDDEHIEPFEDLKSTKKETEKKFVLNFCYLLDKD